MLTLRDCFMAYPMAPLWDQSHLVGRFLKILESRLWPFRTATHLLGLKQAILLILMVGVTLTTARFSAIQLLTIFFLSRHLAARIQRSYGTKTVNFSCIVFVTKCCMYTQTFYNLRCSETSEQYSTCFTSISIQYTQIQVTPLAEIFHDDDTFRTFFSLFGLS